MYVYASVCMCVSVYDLSLTSCGGTSYVRVRRSTRAYESMQGRIKNIPVDKVGRKVYKIQQNHSIYYIVRVMRRKYRKTILYIVYIVSYLS